MTLSSQVHEQIRRYVVGLVSADDLSDWLSTRAREIFDSGDADLRRLMDLAFSTTEDVFNGVRTDDDAREVLGEGVSTTTITLWVDSPGAQITGSDALTLNVTT